MHIPTQGYKDHEESEKLDSVKWPQVTGPKEVEIQELTEKNSK